MVVVAARVNLQLLLATHMTALLLTTLQLQVQQQHRHNRLPQLASSLRLL